MKSSFVFRTFSCLLFIVSTLGFAGLNDGLVGHWDFESNYNDISGNGNNGTAYNGPTFATGRFGQAVVLDGVNDYIRIPNSSDFQFSGGDFSISAWIYPESTVSNARIVDTRGQGLSTPGWMLKIDDNSGVWNIEQAGIDDGTSLITCSGCGEDYSYDGWHHVVMIYNNDSSIQFYVDGKFDGSVSTGTLGSADNTLPLVIGASLASNGVESTAAQFFAGKLDDIRIYNRALSTSEIRELNGDQIMADTTLYVPSDYSTVQEALASIEFKRISSQATVTIQIANGTYSNYETINLTHPDGDRIQLVGNPASQSSCKLIFKSATNGIVVDNGHKLGLITGLTLTGTNKNAEGILAIRNSVIYNIDKVSVDNWSNGIFVRFGATLAANTVTSSSNGQRGVRVDQGASAYMYGCTMTANTMDGIYVVGNGSLGFYNGTSTNNSNRGVFAHQSSEVMFWNSTVSGNSWEALYSAGSAVINYTGSSVSGSVTAVYNGYNYTQ